MVLIKPLIEDAAVSEPGRRRIPADYILWQGIHVCAVTKKDGKDVQVTDLPIGHSAHFPFSVNLAERSLAGMRPGLEWLGQPLLDSLMAPNPDVVAFEREMLAERKQVIILNCLDFLYGHCLLKLLNAERHLQRQPEFGLVVLIPEFLRWLVPDGVAEVWTVKLNLKQMLNYYPALHEQITKECGRFERILLSEGFSHPSEFHIENFTRIQPRQSSATEPPLLTFVWREDRLWLPERSRRPLEKLASHRMRLGAQNRQITRCFEAVRARRADAQFCVAGLGTATQFPSWVTDHRVEKFTAESERATALCYARSRVVIGIHGSNMLLPSGLAGMTIDLMPHDKWACLPEDILFQEPDPRLAVLYNRFVPFETSPRTLAEVALAMINNAHNLVPFFTEDGQAAGRRK